MVCVISWLVAALRSFSEGSRNEAEVHNDIRSKSSIHLAARGARAIKPGSLMKVSGPRSFTVRRLGSIGFD
jgi:hypothetical protein